MLVVVVGMLSLNKKIESCLCVLYGFIIKGRMVVVMMMMLNATRLGGMMMMMMSCHVTTLTRHSPPHLPTKFL